MEDSPSLRRDLGEKTGKSYEKAKLKAEGEIGIDREHFPEACPFSPIEILDMEFFPE